MPCRENPQWLSEPLAAFALLLGREVPLGPFDIWEISLFTITRGRAGGKGWERIPKTWNAN